MQQNPPSPPPPPTAPPPPPHPPSPPGPQALSQAAFQGCKGSSSTHLQGMHTLNLFFPLSPPEIASYSRSCRMVWQFCLQNCVQQDRDLHYTLSTACCLLHSAAPHSTAPHSTAQRITARSVHCIAMCREAFSLQWGMEGQGCAFFSTLAHAIQQTYQRSA